MIIAEKRENRIIVEAGFSEKDLILRLPGARWNREEQVCHLPLSYASCKQLRGILGDELEIGNELYAWAVEDVRFRVDPCLKLRQATSLTGADELVPGLYPFQEVGAHFLIAAKQALLGDPMGSGKTVQAIAAAKNIDSLPALIVCPNSTKISWAREIETWWPGVPVTIIEGTKAQRQKKILETGKGICIINWESVRLHSRLSPYGTIRLRTCSNCNPRGSDFPLSKCERCPKELNQIPWQLIIADEAHRMKDPKSKQTRAVWSVGENVHWKWCLTGTPLTKTPDTLWPILHFLNPTEWPAKTAFINRYCDSMPSRWGPGIEVLGLNEQTEQEFFEIFDPRFRRMPKEIVLPNLPPIQYVQRHVEMSPEQARSYSTMVDDLVAVDENGELIIASNPISRATRLIQYSSACLTLNEAGQARMTSPSCKINQLMVDLDDYLTSDESVVVFAVHRQLIEMAERALKEKKIPFSVIKGGQSESDRQSQIDNFQSGKVPVILVVIAAGGVGVTLSRGRIAVFLQRPWSNVDHQQAMGRVHRIGSEIHDSVIIVDYITRQTVERYQLRALQGKANQLEAVVRDRDTIERLLRGEDEQ